MKNHLLSALSTLSRALLLAAVACFASGPLACASAAQEPTAPGSAAPAPQGLPTVCLDVQAADGLIKDFADRLRETITASGAFSLGAATDSCSLQLHVPGNLLRFQTAGGVMVSTVVIVTSASGHYLSTSVAACQANDLKPCAVRAVAAAKLALLVTTDNGT